MKLHQPLLGVTDEETSSIIDKLKDVVGNNNKKERFLLEIVSYSKYSISIWR